MKCPGTYEDYRFGCTYITKEQLDSSSDLGKLLANYTSDLMQVCAGGITKDECDKYCSDDCEEFSNINQDIVVKVGTKDLGTVPHNNYHCNYSNILLNPKDFQHRKNYTYDCVINATRNFFLH